MGHCAYLSSHSVLTFSFSLENYVFLLGLTSMVHHDVTAIVLSCSWRQRAHTVFLRSVLYLPHIKGPHFFCAPPNFACHAHPSTLYLLCHTFSDATQCSEEVQPAAKL